MIRDFEVVMRTHGQITFAPYVHGESPRADFFPGYRSDFYTFVDFFSWKGLISNWLIASTTLMERPDSTLFRLDRIRYTLTPGYRYKEFGLLRYHVGRWGNWGLFVDMPQHLWVAANKRIEAKVSPTINLFLLGRYNIASLFYTWHVHDSSTHDNEESLGLFGFKIVF